MTDDERAEIVSLVMRVLPKTARASITPKDPEKEEGEEPRGSAISATEALTSNRPPACKRWKLFLPNETAAFAVMSWQSVRLWRAIRAFPDNVISAPVDDSISPEKLSEIHFFNILPITVEQQAAEVIDEKFATLGADTAVTAKQMQFLLELKWPFAAKDLFHYRHADYVIRWWAEHLGVSPIYEDPDSPWSFNRQTREGSWHKEPATDAQISYLKALRVSGAESMSKAEASKAIDERLHTSGSVSNRQMMVLRFWDKISVAEGGRAAVSEWQNEWYDGDMDRKAAWELWKEETSDRGQQSDPNVVTLGIGWKYLDKVKSGPSVSAPNRKSAGCLSVVLIAGIIVTAGVVKVLSS